MKFVNPLEKVTILKRYKRFFADVKYPDGTELTVHVPNTGPMLGAFNPGWDGYIMAKVNPKKMSHGLELMEDPDGTLMGVNTQIPNRIVKEALESKELYFATDYENIKPEAKIGNSKIDFLLTQEGFPDCYLEVKNCSGKEKDTAFFPDTKSERALKHINELRDLNKKGIRTILVFIIQRGDCKFFRPGDEYHPEYGKALREAISEGVEVYPLSCKISLTEISIDKQLILKI